MGWGVGVGSGRIRRGFRGLILFGQEVAYLEGRRCGGLCGIWCGAVAWRGGHGMICCRCR